MKASEDIFYTKNFCILPWLHFHAWPDSKVFPCCMADSSKPLTNLTEHDTLLDMMNSEKFKELRLNMLNDIPSDICKRCYDVELFGTWSLRQSQNTVRGIANLDQVNATNDDGSIDKFELKYMDIRFSNICNMKCRSCGPSCSSQWASEYRERYGEARLKSRFGLEKIVVSNNDDGSFWEKLKPHLLDVDEVYFAGGEALITPEHYKILDYWLEHNKTDVRITYTTNFSQLNYKNKDILKYWRKFQFVEIYASLDASGPLAEFMRKGTDWNQVEENARMIIKEVPHIRFELTPTISIWNLHQFPHFHKDWIEKGFLHKDREIRLNILTNPWYCSILILPQFYRDRMASMYDDVFRDLSYSESIRNAYKTVLNTLKSGEENKDGIKQFFSFNDELDEVRKEKLFDALPELREVYEWSQI